MDSPKLKNALVILAIVVAVIWLSQFFWGLAARFSTALLIFFLAWLVSFALSPAVRRLCRTGLPRMPATILVYLGLAGAGVLISLFVVPAVVQDLALVAVRIGDYGDDLQRLLDDLFEWLRALGVPEQALKDAIGNLGSKFADVGAAGLSTAVGAFAGIATALLVFVLTLVVSFYLVIDWDRSLQRFERSLPGNLGRELREAVIAIEATFAGFLRAQLIESALFGAAVAVTMLAAGLDFVVVVSIFSGLVLVIPFVGAAAGVLAPVLAALLESPVTALWVGLILFAIQLVLENVVKPRLVGTAVGVHPIVVIAGILVGSTAAGFWGAVFGVPFGALVYIAARAAFARWVGNGKRRAEASTQPTSVSAAPANQDPARQALP